MFFKKNIYITSCIFSLPENKRKLAQWWKLTSTSLCLPKLFKKLSSEPKKMPNFYQPIQMTINPGSLCSQSQIVKCCTVVCEGIPILK